VPAIRLADHLRGSRPPFHRQADAQRVTVEVINPLEDLALLGPLCDCHVNPAGARRGVDPIGRLCEYPWTGFQRPLVARHDDLYALQRSLEWLFVAILDQGDNLPGPFQAFQLFADLGGERRTLLQEPVGGAAKNLPKLIAVARGRPGLAKRMVG